jgi:hypothetical protein
MNMVWTLSSSDGWDQVSERVLRYWTDRSQEAMFLFKISTSGRFWQRDADALGYLQTISSAIFYKSSFAKVLLAEGVK